MCYYDQYVFACKDWKWGNFRQHCPKEYRIGETCGMKMCYQSITLTELCKPCQKIEAKQRRFQKHRSDVERWSREPGRYRASIEKAVTEMENLQVEVTQLNLESRQRYAAIGNTISQAQSVQSDASGSKIETSRMSVYHDEQDQDHLQRRTLPSDCRAEMRNLSDPISSRTPAVLASTMIPVAEPHYKSVSHLNEISVPSNTAMRSAVAAVQGDDNLMSSAVDGHSVTPAVASIAVPKHTACVRCRTQGVECNPYREGCLLYRGMHITTVSQYVENEDAKGSLASDLASEILRGLSTTDISVLVEGAKQSSFIVKVLNILMRAFSILLADDAIEQTEIDAVSFTRQERSRFVTELMKQLGNTNAESEQSLPSAHHVDVAVNKAVTLCEWVTASFAGTISTSTSSDSRRAVDIVDQETVCATEADIVSSDLPFKQQYRQFWLQSKAFAWLIAQLMQWLHAEDWLPSSWSQAQIISLIDHKGLGKSMSMKISLPSIDMLESNGQRTKLAEMIVYSGPANRCSATTVSEYVQRFWPTTGHQVITAVERFLFDGVSASQIADGKFCCALMDGQLFVGICGKVQTMLEIAETLVWLSLACREAPTPDQPSYCSAKLTIDKSCMKVEPVHEAIALHDKEDSLCWLQMVRNPVLVVGFALPERTERQKGLEVSFAVLVAMSQANFAVTFGSTFLLKGIVSALVPVLADSSSIVWHFLLNHDLSGMSYNQACLRAPQVDLQISDINKMTTQRHFVGIWLKDAEFQAGRNSEDAHRLKPSLSKPFRGQVSQIPHLTMAAGMYLAISASVKLLKKDVAAELAVCAERCFEMEMIRASEIQVLLYGSSDKRGWLLDGASALLELTRAWMSSEIGEYVLPCAFEKYQSPKHAGGPKEARAALIANKSLNLGLHYGYKSGFESDRSSEPSSDVDSGYASMSSTKDEQKCSWTLGNTVLEMWKYLELMHDRLVDADAEPPSMSLNVLDEMKEPCLVGWDAVGLVSSKSRLEPRMIKLGQNARHWAQLTRTSHAVTLFASTFGDLIIPRYPGGCTRQSSMPKDHYLLAVPLYIWREWSENWLNESDDQSPGCVELECGQYWHSFDPDAEICRCAGDEYCAIISNVGDIDDHDERVVQDENRARMINVFEQYPNGVALLGLKMSKSTSNMPPQDPG